MGDEPGGRGPPEDGRRTERHSERHEDPGGSRPPEGGAEPGQDDEELTEEEREDDYGKET